MNLFLDTKRGTHVILIWQAIRPYPLVKAVRGDSIIVAGGKKHETLRNFITVYII